MPDESNGLCLNCYAYKPEFAWSSNTDKQGCHKEWKEWTDYGKWCWRECTDNDPPEVCGTSKDDKPSYVGCIDPIAENYDSTKTGDDGSCEYILGCTDLKAVNYNSTATKDDGSCIEKLSDENFKQVVSSCLPGEYNSNCVDSIYGPISGWDTSKVTDMSLSLIHI